MNIYLLGLTLFSNIIQIQWFFLNVFSTSLKQNNNFVIKQMEVRCAHHFISIPLVFLKVKEIEY